MNTTRETLDAAHNAFHEALVIFYKNTPTSAMGSEGSKQLAHMVHAAGVLYGLGVQLAAQQDHDTP